MRLYITGKPASKGGLRMSDLRLWDSITSALESLKDDRGAISRWGNRLYRATPDGTPTLNMDMGKLGYGTLYQTKKAIERRPAVRIMAAAGEQFELHQRYGKHEWQPALGEHNYIQECPSCGAFGILTHINYNSEIKILPVLPSDFKAMLLLPELMEILPAEKRFKLGSYLISIGYGSRDSSKLEELKHLMEETCPTGQPT